MVRSAVLAYALVLAACEIVSCKPANGPTSQPVRFSLSADDGRLIRADEFRGRFLIVHVFATWSMPATDDALRLDKAFGAMNDVAIVGVSMDEQSTGQSVLAAWRRGLGVRYTLVTADEAIRSGHSSLGPANAVPFTLVFDKSGRQLDRIDAPLGTAGIARLREQIL